MALRAFFNALSSPPCLLAECRQGNSIAKSTVPVAKWRIAFIEQKLQLSSDRTSTHTNECNQLRLWFASLAYVLIQALRQHCLAKTELAQAQVGTIRTQLLKLGAQVKLSARRILISISSGCPFQDVFTIAYRKLQTLPQVG